MFFGVKTCKLWKYCACEQLWVRTLRASGSQLPPQPEDAGRCWRGGCCLLAAPTFSSSTLHEVPSPGCLLATGRLALDPQDQASGLKREPAPWSPLGGRRTSRGSRPARGCRRFTFIKPPVSQRRKLRGKRVGGSLETEWGWATAMR